MSIYKRGDTYYYDFTIKGVRHNRSTGTADRREAVAAEKAAVKAARVTRPEPTMTMDAAMQKAYRERWGTRKDGEQTMSRLDMVASYLGHDTPINHFDRAMIEQVRDWLLKTGRGPATTNRYLAAVKTLLRMAHEWGALDKVPPVRLEHEQPEHRRALSAEELTLIARYADIDTCRLIWWLVDTGMRLSEALSLRYEDIRDGCAHLKDTKAGKPRVVPLTERAMRCISAMPDGRLFRYGKWRYARAFKDAVRAAGVNPQGVCLHALRHTCCTNLVTRGAGLLAAGAVLGHSTTTMTSRYAHLDVAALRKTINLLEGEKS